MSNQETALAILRSHADKVSETDTRVVCEIDGPNPSSGLDEQRYEHLSCYLVSRPEAPRRSELFELVAIDYSPKGNFEGAMRIRYGESQGFADESEYGKQLDVAFNDPEIVKEIETMRRVCGHKKP